MTWQHISAPLSRIMKEIEANMAKRRILPLLSADYFYDFSNCRPGDVARFRLKTTTQFDLETARAVVSSIAIAATRAGLRWESVRDDKSQELRISFR